MNAFGAATARAPSARAQCLEAYQHLVAAGKSDADIESALEALALSLADLVPSVVGDLEVATRIGDIRAMVEAHLLAVYQLDAAGADPSRASLVLRRAYRQACADLARLVGAGQD